MNTLQKLFFSFFTAHFFIALVAVLLSLETAIILNQPFQTISLYLFVFFATLFAYNVYYINTESGYIHKLLALLSLISGMVVLFFVQGLFYAKLLLIALPSAIYILPIFFPFEMNRGFRFFKLLLLIYVWVATTFILPISSFQYQSTIMVYLLYRVVLMSFACILFFIRDEPDVVLRRRAIIGTWIILLLQFVLAGIVMSTLHTALGICYLLISFLNTYIGYRFLYSKQPNLHYQIFVDGVLFLQAFIVVIIYFLKLS